MAEYSFEQKLKIVQEDQAGCGGYGDLAKKYGVADKWQVKRRVEAYKAFGADGLMRSGNGADALKPKRKGRRPVMNPPKNVCQAEHGNPSTDPGYLKQLKEDSYLIPSLVQSY